MLNVITRQEAVQRILERIPEKRNCTLYLPDAVYAGQDITSPEDLPPCSRSVVDGFAVRSSDTYGCSESIPAMLLYDGQIQMGQMPYESLERGHCMAIPTGGFLPEGADAVSMIEYTEDSEDEFRYILKPLAVSENVNRKGDDCHKGDILVRKGEQITSRNIAVLAATGAAGTAELIRKYCSAAEDKGKGFRLGILSTGDELVEYDQTPLPGQIRNINAVMLCAAARELGLVPVIYDIVPDELELLRKAMDRAVSECDAVCISGGTSVGEKDHVFQVLSGQGTVLFHGLARKPGKPTMFAMIRDVPVFSLPGHPMAAFMVFWLTVRPALLQMTGRQQKADKRKAFVSRNLSSNHGREEIIPVRLEGDRAVPLRAGSGVVSVLSKADGLIIIDRNAEGILEGERVDVYML